MIPGVRTWDHLGPIDGNVLLVLNSAPGDSGAADAVFAALESLVPRAALHVVAERQWSGWISERGLPADRVLYCSDYEGREIEVNHFLESPDAVLWTVDKQFGAIIGSDPHDLHNERVNDIFEQRALLLLEDGVMLAHTLPNRYVYVFDTPRLLERRGRGPNVEAYERRSQAIVGDLYQLWIASGKPSVADGPDYNDVLDVLAKRLGTPLLDYDEAGPIPLAHEPLTTACADVVARLRSVVREHDRQLRVWSVAYAERKEAADVREAGVRLRDTIIDDLRLQLEPWHRKLRRRWKEKRVKGPS